MVDALTGLDRLRSSHEYDNLIAELDRIAAALNHPGVQPILPRTIASDVVDLLALARDIFADTLSAVFRSKTDVVATGGDGESMAVISASRAAEPITVLAGQVATIDGFLTKDRSGALLVELELRSAVSTVSALVELAAEGIRSVDEWNVPRLPGRPDLAPHVSLTGTPHYPAEGSSAVNATVFHLCTVHTRVKALIVTGRLEHAQRLCDAVFREYRSLVRLYPDLELRREYLVVVGRLCEILISQDRQHLALPILEDIHRRCQWHPLLTPIADRANHLQFAIWAEDESTEFERWEAQLDAELRQAGLIGVPHDLGDAYGGNAAFDDELIRIGVADPSDDDPTGGDDDRAKCHEQGPNSLTTGQVLGILNYYLGARVVPHRVIADSPAASDTTDLPGDPTMYPPSLAKLLDPPLAQLAIRTGFEEVDELLSGGLRPGSLTIIGSHSGVGSSTLALGIVRTAAITHGVPTRYLVFNRHINDVHRRIVSAESNIGIGVLETGAITAGHERLKTAVERIDASPLTVTATRKRDKATVLDDIEVTIWGTGVSLVIVDPLNLIGVPGGLADDRFEPTPELNSSYMADVARRLKGIAQDNNVAVVVVAQVPGLPTDPMSDVAALGPAGECADTVLMLYRPDRWDRDTPRAGEADITIAKGIFSPATATVAHQLHKCRFIDMGRG